MINNMSNKYTVIDLFAGAGGLSLGFEQTDKFVIKAAFEKNEAARKTYQSHFKHADVKGDIYAADFGSIREQYGPIDVVIGGPPCQGFSNANRQQSNHAVNQNNILVKQYIRAIQELQPKAFVMENVGMLRSDVHRFYLDIKDEAFFQQHDIQVKTKSLCLLEEKFNFDGLQALLQDTNRIQSCMWPDKDYSELNIIYKAAKKESKLRAALSRHKKYIMERAKSYINYDGDEYILQRSKVVFAALQDYYKDNDCTDLRKIMEPSIMHQRMFRILREIKDNDLVVDHYHYDNGVIADIRSFAVLDYLKAILEAPPNNYVLKYDVLCAADYGVPQKRKRFILIGVKKSIRSDFELPSGKGKNAGYHTVKEAIQDLEKIKPVYDLLDDNGISLNGYPDKISEYAQKLRDKKEVLYNHLATKTTDVAMERFEALKQGENFHNLASFLKTNTYTDAKRTQNTIYLRLNYAQPSGTVTNVRKSMWIHPTLNRAISVREAARLQSFPDTYIFYGTKDQQYQQVGNAVPPMMAKAIARKVAKILKDAKEG